MVVTLVELPVLGDTGWRSLAGWMSVVSGDTGWMVVSLMELPVFGDTGWMSMGYKYPRLKLSRDRRNRRQSTIQPVSPNTGTPDSNCQGTTGTADSPPSSQCPQTQVAPQEIPPSSQCPQTLQTSSQPGIYSDYQGTVGTADSPPSSQCPQTQVAPQEIPPSSQCPQTLQRSSQPGIW
ncbi:hypothetical protein F0562_017528 [Nyssa sinensis]|uniref:Uncharacterized protein n=1 Tax=Nyssa sinensis TaxID=561372 RepID=A0A5J4ZFD9_9ASTE|nr:hypothetical protein F0562_017528 [Nyssa sinensis]